jgi:uncharacterized protein
MILCDAGVLFCLVDRTQPQHVAYQNAVIRLAKPLVTTWSCLTEAMYLSLHRGGWMMQKQLGQKPRPDGVTKMKGEENTYRLRVKKYRIIYEIRDEQLIVLVIKVGHRREGYRKS